jgi:hypothetical protein
MRKLFILLLIAFTMKGFGQTYTLGIESEANWDVMVLTGCNKGRFPHFTESDFG